MQPRTAWLLSCLSLGLDGIILCVISSFPHFFGWRGPCCWAYLYVIHSRSSGDQPPKFISPHTFNGHLGCFQIRALAKSAAVNVLGLVFWPTYVQVSLGHMPRNKAGEPWRMHGLNSQVLPTIFQGAAFYFHSIHGVSLRVPVALHSG